MILIKDLYIYLFASLMLFVSCQSSPQEPEGEQPQASFEQLLNHWDIEAEIELLFVLDGRICPPCSKALLDILEALPPEKHRICSSLEPHKIDLSRYQKEPYKSVYRKDYQNSFREAGYIKGAGLFLLKNGKLERTIELDALNISEQIKEIRELLVARKLLVPDWDGSPLIQWIESR